MITSLQDLLESVVECLRLAANSGYMSVAIPALGMGNLKYPPKKVASALIDGVATYHERFNETQKTIKTVSIVLYDTNDDIIKVNYITTDSF